MSCLFIPKKIRVGFQKRKDTYTNRLAYIIYYDAKGKLRKEISWESWRDNTIKPQEFDNDPQDGFVLNKNIERYNWNHYGSGRSYIRIYDPREIEFEVTPENLIGILMHTNCCKRQLEDKFVYAWQGKELILLPVSSEEYKKAKEYTLLQGKKFSLLDLVPGRSYTTKNQKEIVYLGRFMWFEIKGYNGKRIGKKKHIFHVENVTYRNNFIALTSANDIAVENSEEPVNNFAKLIDKFKNDDYSSSVVGVDIKPVVIDLSTGNNHYDKKMFNKTHYFKRDNEIAMEFVIRKSPKTRYYDALKKDENEIDKYTLISHRSINLETLEVNYMNNNHNHNYIDIDYNMGHPCIKYTRNELIEKLKTMEEVYLVFENGNKKHIEGYI